MLWLKFVLDILDLLNVGTVEFSLCEISRLMEQIFLFFFRQLCDKKTCSFVVMGIGNKVMWAGGGMGRGH